jgi:hypothetical protein
MDFLGVQSVVTVGTCTTSLSIDRASVFVMPCFIIFADTSRGITLNQVGR